MRAAHMKMAKETTVEQPANAANLAALKNFFKDLFGHCSFSLSRNHPAVAYFSPKRLSFCLLCIATQRLVDMMNHIDKPEYKI